MDRKRAGDFLGGHMGDRKTEKRGRVETNVDEQMKNPVVQEAPSSELSTMLTHLNDPQGQSWPLTNDQHRTASLAYPQPSIPIQPSVSPQLAASPEQTTASRPFEPPQSTLRDHQSTSEPRLSTSSPFSTMPLLATAWLPGSRYQPSMSQSSMHDQRSASTLRNIQPSKPELHGNLHTLHKCQSCSRRLRLDLFNPGSIHCHNCTRRRIIAKEIRQRGAGQVQFSVNNTFMTQNLPVPPGQMDPVVYLNSISDKIHASLTDALKMHAAIKFYLTVSINMMRFVGVEIHREVGYFVSIPTVLLHESDIDELVQRAVSLIMERAEAFLRFGSGWTYDDLKSVDIHTCPYNMIGGSSYIPTPPRFKNQCLINIQNNNEKCFAYSILAAIFPAKNNVCAPWRYEKYMDTLNFEGINFPVKIDQIKKFEKQNDAISINVQHVAPGGNLLSLYASEHRDRKHHINLLLLNESVSVDAEGNETVWDGITDLPVDHTVIHRSHYTLVKNLSALVRFRSKQKSLVHVCQYCLRCFSGEHVLQNHLDACSKHKPCAIKFPSKFVKKRKNVEEEGKSYETIEEALGIDADIAAENANKNKKLPENILYFKNHQHTMPVPFCIYADFEAFIGEDDVHEPSGFCCLTVSSFDFLNNQEAFVFSGENIIPAFFQHIQNEHNRINSILSQCNPMDKLTEEEQLNYDEATQCKTCNKIFSERNAKVRHHDHLTGKFIAATCNTCNLKLKPRMSRTMTPSAYQLKVQALENYNNQLLQIEEEQNLESWRKTKANDYLLPIIFHNLKGYDSHLIIKNLEKQFAVDEIKVIASNSEKFISFQIGQKRFLDSLQFLNASLDTLVSNLKKDGTENFIHTKRHFFENEELVIRKGIYMYEYMIERDKFLETQLPPKEAFFSKLSDSHISDEDYDHANIVWDKFGMKTLRDYHDLYLKTDVLLLADVFESFRKSSLESYALDPLHYYTSPSLSMAACLKYTDIKLELISDIDILLTLESGVRGGISSIMNRYSRANNKYMTDFDPDQPSKYIMYWDANNLYGGALSEYLPTGGLRFLSNQEIDEFNLDKISADSEDGFILEIDLDYPESLHDLHNAYPLAAESLTITPEMYSPYAKELLEKLGKKPPPESKKLCPNLFNKTKYICHYRNAQFYVKMGMKITKVHRIITFKQSPWLAKYIQLNTDKRKVAKSAFEKDMYKLMNNAIFGKCLENLRKRIHVKLVTDTRKAERLCALPTFDSFNIVNEDITLIKSNPGHILWNKPTYVGFCVLELSKLTMYEFHYEKILPLYGENAKLLFTDTDSLCYELKTDDVYADMKENLSWFDTSDYPVDHFCYSQENSKVIGKMKDEMHAVIVKEFCGLKSKMYSLIDCQDHEKLTAKGIKRSFAAKHLRHEMYKNCLFAETKTSAQFHTLRSRNHKIRTELVVKDCLSCFDSKRYLLADTKDTLAHGHYSIKYK